MSNQSKYWNTEKQRYFLCRLLLAEAGRLYEKHDDRRHEEYEPFNIFSVLRRSESDEVNLHSRFLHALLDYRELKSGIRKNLKIFLKHIGIVNFELDGESVEREQDKIDILIRNKDTAVAIENKIYAGDEDEQLHRYKEKLESLGYKNIHMVYLTLWGKDPTSDSLGDLDNEEIIKISYQYSPEPEKSIRPWLKDCQNRAYDNFGLKAVIEQYRQLVQKLTGKNLKEAYMTELLNLLLQNNNLNVFDDLQTTINYARNKSMKKLWHEIDSELRQKIPEIPVKGNEVTDNDIFKFSTKKNW